MKWVGRAKLDIGGPDFDSGRAGLDSTGSALHANEPAKA